MIRLFAVAIASLLTGAFLGWAYAGLGAVAGPTVRIDGARRERALAWGV